jgi:hypothetical protein
MLAQSEVLVVRRDASGSNQHPNSRLSVDSPVQSQIEKWKLKMDEFFMVSDVVAYFDNWHPSNFRLVNRLHVAIK